MGTVWVLVTDSDDYGLVATLHRTEADAYECLRDNFLSGSGISFDDIADAMTRQPDVMWAITEEVLP